MRGGCAWHGDCRELPAKYARPELDRQLQWTRREEHMEAVTQMEMETITSVWTRRDAVALVALVTFVSLAAYWLTV